MLYEEDKYKISFDNDEVADDMNRSRMRVKLSELMGRMLEGIEIDKMERTIILTLGRK